MACALWWMYGTALVESVWTSKNGEVLDLPKETGRKKSMAHEHTYPEALDTLVTRLPELELVLGPAAKPGLESVRMLLQEAIAARAAGDVPRAMARIGTAMDTLAQLANVLDPHEAMMMRTLAAHFRQALSRGDRSEAHRTSDLMREKSGTTLKKKR